MPSFTISELFPSVLSWEFFGFITGILSVLLLIPTKLSRLQWTSWIFSVASAAVYLFLFYDWTLYGNAILQIPFLIISFQGAWKWRGQLRGLVTSVREIPTTYASIATLNATIMLALLATIPTFYLLERFGDASPLWDGLFLTISIAAIFLQLRKYVESWYLWIVVDIIAVPFHISQDRGATALLYFIYLLMCFVGLKTWKDIADEDVRSVEEVFQAVQ